MVSRSDPVESFLQSVKDAISPLESGFLSFSRDLESHWSKDSRSELRNVEFFTRSYGLMEKKPNLDPSVLVSSSDEKNKGFKTFIGSIFPNSSKKRGAKEEEEEKEESCSNCLHFAVSWSLFLNGFVQAFPSPFKSVKKCFENPCVQQDDLKPKQRQKFKSLDLREKEKLSFEFLLCLALDNLVKNLQIFDHRKLISGIIKGKKADVNGLLANIRFARVGGAPASLVEDASSVNDEGGSRVSNADKEEAESGSTQKPPGGILNIPLSTVESLKSTLPSVLLTELIEFIPQLGKSTSEHPDKKKLFSVQDFFRYTETEGKRFFEELDRDGDGQVTLEDLEVAMRNRKLPRRYARDLLRRTRSNLFAKSIGWKQFLSLMEQKEPTILRAYTTLCLSKSGTLKKNQILTSLQSAGLPANEDNAVAMMRYLNADTGQSISYSHFRNFMLLLPSERLEDDPRSVWFEAATVVAVPPPVEISTENVLKSALAGGLACALSTSVLHPVDTIKTRVQASTLSFPEIISNLPQIGVQGLYRGSIPAILGQFSSHGLRTGIFEASKLVLINVAPNLPELQVQSMASFCSTILGTAVRIPCEVLKQRLQAGIFDNVGEAIVGTFRQDGLKGFFRGTGATLCREVPFYVAGMCLYAESKKAAQGLLNRELEPWETIAVGAISGGLAAVVTTPFDVMKTRMMTAPRGLPVSMQMVAFSILRQEGPVGLFKGAVPRFFWIAPLGAMNFAGYELAKKAMDKSENMPTDQLP